LLLQYKPFKLVILFLIFYQFSQHQGIKVPFKGGLSWSLFLEESKFGRLGHLTRFSHQIYDTKHFVKKTSSSFESLTFKIFFFIDFDFVRVRAAPHRDRGRTLQERHGHPARVLEGLRVRQKQKRQLH
jgi:hypothetical protein